MFKAVKEKLYFLKIWYRDIFLYPREKIDIHDSLDYNNYWKEKLSSGRTLGLTSYELARADLVLSILVKEKEEVVVGDIASGPGIVLHYLKSKLPEMKGMCYDVSEYALGLARERGMETSSLNIKNIRELHSLIATDYFLMLEILEHIPHSEEVLDTLYKKSNKGVFFSFPNSGYFIYRLRLLFGKFPKQWVTFPNEHLRFWTATDLKWWLKALGYEDYTIHYYKGVPMLNNFLPSLFAAGFIVFLKK